MLWINGFQFHANLEQGGSDASAVSSTAGNSLWNDILEKLGWRSLGVGRVQVPAKVLTKQN